MAFLKPFREIPRDLAEWTRWMKAQGDLAGAGESVLGSSSSTRSSKYWSFGSPSGASGTFYFGGFYQFHGSSITPAGGTNIGTANSSYAAHLSFVLGAASTDMVIRVTGTSINDLGVRTASDTQDVNTGGGAANSYYETSKKWIGQVSVSLQSGTGVVTNVFFSKYWDFGNTDFTVVGCEALWLGGAADAAPNIEILHHTENNWTYGAGGTATTTSVIAAMATDHTTAEDEVVNGEAGAWKRTNLDQLVRGSSAEGILWRVTTTANKAFELGNLELTVTQ